MNNKEQSVLHILPPKELKEFIFSSVDEAFKKNLKSLKKQKKNKDWMTRKEVSEMLGVSLVSISAWTKKGILKGYKISGRVRYIREQVELAIIKNTE